MECEASLAKLVGSVAGVDEVIVKGSPLPAFDVQCPIVSLPLKFATTLPLSGTPEAARLVRMRSASITSAPAIMSRKSRLDPRAEAISGN